MRSTITFLIAAIACGLPAFAGETPPLPVRSAFDGPGLAFEFPAVRIGVAEYDDGPTGATVMTFRDPVMAAVDVRGGAPGTVSTDGLRLSYDEPFVNAISLAGGSSYGLSVATGVANALKERTVDAGSWKHIATVPGAIIFDLGGRRYNAVTPDERLGRAALDAARSGWIPLGARGAGRFAMQGFYFGDLQHSGQGAAFRRSGDTKVLVVTVVNAVGLVVDRGGRIQRCARPVGNDCGTIADRIAAHLAALQAAPVAAPDPGKHAGPTANTTITVVVTNQALPYWALQRLAVQVHNSMARAIQPFGTEYDGDTLFAVTTGELKHDGLSSADLGTLASETAWDAILASTPVVPPPTPAVEAAMSPALAEAAVGRYEFAPGVVAEVRRAALGLEVRVADADSSYLPQGQWVELHLVGTDEFELRTPRADRAHLDRDRKGNIVGLTINPGPWPVRARRLVTG